MKKRNEREKVSELRGKEWEDDQRRSRKDYDVSQQRRKKKKENNNKRGKEEREKILKKKKKMEGKKRENYWEKSRWRGWKRRKYILREWK